MKSLIFLTLLFSVCALTFADEAIGYLKDPAHPGKCVYEGLVLSAGEEGKVPDRCLRVLCGKDSFATIQGCGVMVAPVGCKYTDYINVNAPYGECCEKKLVCK